MPLLWGVLSVHCPFCGADDTKVIDSRLVAEGDSVRRRRECQACSERFTTFETAELVMPRIVKRDGSREPFNEDKLRDGLQKALEKRPVSIEEIDSSLNRITHRLRSTGERELPSIMRLQPTRPPLHMCQYLEKRDSSFLLKISKPSNPWRKKTS